jgi:acetyl esterase/lipase
MVPGPGTQDVLDVITVEPANRRGPTGAVLWLHGGGFVMGGPESELAAAGKLARELGAIVALPRYSLAPEDPFPAALDDCLAALRWLHSEASDLGIDRNRMALLGISAGGGLAAALAQRNRDSAQLPIAAQVLVYPMLDDRTVLRKDDEDRGRLVWTARSNRFAWRSYLGGPPGHRGLRPWAVPGRCDNLDGLPPAWIGVGDLDLFYEEDVEYAHRLAAAGVDVELHVAPGMYHAADKFAPESAESLRGFRQSQVEALRRAIC